MYNFSELKSLANSANIRSSLKFLLIHYFNGNCLSDKQVPVNVLLKVCYIGSWAVIHLQDMSGWWLLTSEYIVFGVEIKLLYKYWYNSLCRFVLFLKCCFRSKEINGGVMICVNPLSCLLIDTHTGRFADQCISYCGFHEFKFYSTCRYSLEFSLKTHTCNLLY